MSSDGIRRLHPVDDAVDTCLLALRLMERLQGWVAAQGPPFTSRYVPVFSLSTAFVTPWLDPDVLHLGTRIWSWITALDDLVDETAVDGTAVDGAMVNGTAVDGAMVNGAAGRVGGLPETVVETLRRCQSVVHDGASGADPVSAALAGIRDEVAALPGFTPLAGHWRDSVGRLVTGMHFEATAGAALARGEPAPQLREYLGHAVHTVGVPMYLLSLWAAMPPGEPAVPPSALRDAALAVRLANDLRGADREGAEQNLNVLRLGPTPEQAGRMLGQRYDDCRRQLAPLLADGHPAAVAAWRMATWGVRLYQRADFRFPSAPPTGDAGEWEVFDWFTDPS